MGELDYIDDFLGNARVLAQRSNLAFLAYLIEIAQIEAADVRVGRATSLPTPKRASPALGAISAQELRRLQRLPEHARAKLMSSLLEEAMREAETG